MEKESKEIIDKMNSEEVTEEKIKESLIEAIEAQGASADGIISSSGTLIETGANLVGKDSRFTKVSQPLYILPIYNDGDSGLDIKHPLFTFRPTQKIPLWDAELEFVTT